MNSKRQSEEEVDMGNAMEDNEYRLIECEGLSTYNLNVMDALHSKYEEIKAQLPGITLLQQQLVLL